MKIMNVVALAAENMSFGEKKNRDLPLTYGQNNNKKRCLFPLHSSQKSVSFIGSHKDFWSVFQNETGK